MSLRFPQPSRERDPNPLDRQQLQALALAYVGRYATSRAKLARYLRRKLALQGWNGEEMPPVDEVVERCAELGYVDDAGFASARGASLARRGYGERRVAETLRAAGIEDDAAAPAREAAREGALAAALAYARRRGIGPFAERAADPQSRQRAIARLMRAGHSPAIARRVASASPGALLEDE